MEQILIKGFPVNYNELELTYENATIINKETAIENLRIFSKIASENKLKYYLSYGTLLGAVRNKDLIDYDIDIDISVFNEKHFLSLINEFEKSGFILVRYEEGILYTLMHNEVYIDFYILGSISLKNPTNHRESIFNKVVQNLFFYKECGMLIPKLLIFIQSSVNLFGGKMKIPIFRKTYLYYFYGFSWRIPQKDKPGYGPDSIKTSLRRMASAIYNEWFKNNFK